MDYKVFPWLDKKYCRQYFTPERIVEAAKKRFSTSGPHTHSGTHTSDNRDISGVKVAVIDHAVDLVDENPMVSDEKEVDREDVDALTANHVIVDIVGRHHGMEEKNPLDFVKFYSKQRPNGEKSSRLMRMDVDSFLAQLLSQQQRK